MNFNTTKTLIYNSPIGESLLLTFGIVLAVGSFVLAAWVLGTYQSCGLLVMPL